MPVLIKAHEEYKITNNGNRRINAYGRIEQYTTPSVYNFGIIEIGSTITISVETSINFLVFTALNALGGDGYIDVVLTSNIGWKKEINSLEKSVDEHNLYINLLANDKNIYLTPLLEQFHMGGLSSYLSNPSNAQNRICTPNPLNFDINVKIQAISNEYLIYVYFENSHLGWSQNCTIPHDTNFKIVLKYNDNSTISDMSTLLSKFLISTIEDVTVPNNIYKNKKISILGDSISTFAGSNAQSAGDGHTIADGDYTYAGNHCRYPTAYLSDVNDTYWMKLINSLEMILGINDSWAGSKVSWNGNEASDYGAGIYIASQTRIDHLGDNGIPDYILVNAGTNDIYSSTLGTFNTDSPKDYTDTEIANLPVNTFADGYRALLIRLQKTYPLSKIVVMLPNFTTVYYTPTKADQYLEVIKEACDYFGVPWIDMRACGVTMYNTGTYLGDGIHPNVSGMNLLYEKVYKYFIYNL